MQPFGGIRMAEGACKSYGYQVDPEVSEIFTKYRKTHNQGVFDAYTPEMKALEKQLSNNEKAMIQHQKKYEKYFQQEQDNWNKILEELNANEENLKDGYEQRRNAQIQE